MYEFWYDYLKPKYGENTKLCYTDTGSLIVHVNVQCSQLHVKTENIDKDIVEDVEARFDT